MSEFLELLSVYYTCDAMVALRPLTQEEFMGCMDVYTMVKNHFAPVFEYADPGTPERAEQMAEAYRGFVDWQAENAGLVAEMRADAAERLENGAVTPAEAL